MTDMELAKGEASDRGVSNGWLKRLAMVVVRPRRTMRQILDGRRDRMIIPLIVLAMVSSSLSDFDRAGFENAIESQLPQTVPPLIVAIVIGVFVAALLVFCILFYIFSWIAVGIGRLLEGRGTVRDVRSALAWGLAPLVWALLIRIPMMFFREPAAPPNLFGPGSLVPDGWIVALAPAGLELAISIWYLVVASLTLGEAHAFSGWRGLATLLLSFASPLVLIIAGVLTAVF